ncbi:neuroligin-4, X-linked-like [Ptychodera flava]|uniref:neuroligin-4, X-linked-like n=1 Tax=Ptychodera flava TaxID=63121 RepID=UPI003969D4A8
MVVFAETAVPFLAVFLIVFHGAIGQPVLETLSGSVRGVTEETQGENISKFLGIPYAKPPVGRRRFRAPEPIGTWADTLNATEFGAICAQNPAYINGIRDTLPHSLMDEDCLTLNIYTPNFDESKNLTVLIFFHGGVFSHGTTMTYDGSTLAALYDVVVVTVNYRVGPFGFLSTMDSHSMGNYGLLDQQLAIRWVKDNIAHFGGDPGKITLFGTSAGAMCVGFQLMSSTNEGLFQRGIAMSGVPTSLSMADKPVFWARRLGSALNCTNVGDSGELISCLKSKSWEDIIENIPSVDNTDVWDRQFMPVVDGVFVPVKPELDSNANFTNYDCLLGFNSNEGKAAYLRPKLKNFVANLTHDPGMTRARFEQLLGDSLRPYFEDELNLLKNAVVNYYTDWSDPTNDLTRLKNFFAFMGDHIFAAPTVGFARKHAMLTAAETRTFLYQFSYGGSDPRYPDWLEGATHGAERPFAFGMPVSMSAGYTNDTIMLSRTMMKYLTNFAKTGDPNSGESVSVSWPEYTVDTQGYLDLDVTVTTADRPKADSMAFWLDYFPGLAATSCPPLPTNCIEVVGEDLGLSLTPQQASDVIQGMIVGMMLLGVLLVVLASVIGAYRIKVKKLENTHDKLEEESG